jgi:hypothetical protein
MGWETAQSMDEALYRARDGQQRSLDVTLLHVPSIVMADVSMRSASRSNGNGA